MLVEHCRMSKAPAFLDMSVISRYQLIIVRLDRQSFEEMTTCILLLRIMVLDSCPEIVIIADSEQQLAPLRSTKLSQTTHLLASSLTSERIRDVLDEIYARSDHDPNDLEEGAPNIPGYRICEPIAGTYGATIYRAYSEQLRTDVALKVRETSDSNCGIAHSLTLRQEFDVLCKLGGDYVGCVFDYGEKDSVAYMAMEYFQHGNIERYFASAGRKANRIDCLLHIAEALREIHNVGFLHLDIKQNNVLIRDDGSPVLIDFGICKRIVSARFEQEKSYSMGSPYFMSPEQISGDTVDVRSDLYSFGALWYRLFTGQVPYCAPVLDTTRIYELRESPPSLGDALHQYQPIIDHTLVADREKRFSTAQELIDMINHCSGKSPLSDTHSSQGVPAYVVANDDSYRPRGNKVSHLTPRGQPTALGT
jgi:serine/threonine protein kinase